MPSERVQRQIDRYLTEAEQAMDQSDWATVRERARAALRFDRDNQDAQTYLDAAERDSVSASSIAPQATSAPVSAPAPAPSQPTSFANGRYVVKRFLGEGGKKRVYLAHDTLLDRDVAFAFIKTEGLDEVGRQRIIREAQAMGRLGSHPHIVSVFDLGEEPVGAGLALPRGGDEPTTQPFMVTELMGGGDVEGAIEKAPDHKLTLERALERAIHTADGLEFAHSKGLVHRDLKPGNVWLTAPLSPLPGQGEAETEGSESQRGGEGEDPVALRREAMEHLDFAIAEFREMKMQPSLERALRHKELLKA